MKRGGILIAIAAAAIIVVLLLWRKPAAQVEKPVAQETPALARIQPPTEHSSPTRPMNVLGDTLMAAQDPEFVNKVFPKFREFIAALNRLGLSPFSGEIQSGSCSKIRIIHLPNGLTCPFVIGDGWTADYLRSDSFEGIAHFGQRGPDNPFRAISRADTDALKRLSEH
ncbi:MAG TPA: hypothetical protein VGF13_09880, partial [Verrucomicrobiae bacterium]